MNPFFNFLVAAPSFSEGAARILDFGGTLTEFNFALNGDQADAIALQSDWYFVGQDIWNAIRIVANRIAKEKCREQQPLAK